MIKPPEHKIVAPLHGGSIGFGSAVGLEIVAAVLKGDTTSAMELFMIPFSDLCMGKESMVPASITGIKSLSGVVV